MKVVGVFVIVPDEITLQFGELELIVVHFCNDFGLPLLAKQSKFFPEADRSVDHIASYQRLSAVAARRHRIERPAETMIAKPNDLATHIGGEAALLSESTMDAWTAPAGPRWVSTFFGTTKATRLTHWKLAFLIHSGDHAKRINCA